MSVLSLINRHYEIQAIKTATINTAVRGGQLAAMADAGLTLKEAEERLGMDEGEADAWLKKAAAEDPLVRAQLHGQIRAYKVAGYSVEEACEELGVPVKTAAEMGALG